MKMYSNRYWEMFNKIDSEFDDVAIRTFKASLPTKHGLRKSLTRKVKDQIDKYKKVQKDQQ